MATSLQLIRAWQSWLMDKCDLPCAIHWNLKPGAGSFGDGHEAFGDGL